MPKSDKQLLLESIYPANLPADIRDWTSVGRSWRWIASTVSARSHHPVSYETLRQWYGDKAKADVA